jgi:hypothetical protein
MRNNPKLMMQMLPDPEDTADEISSNRAKGKMRKRIQEAK